mgnify:CR=1 FL=1
MWGRLSFLVDFLGTAGMAGLCIGLVPYEFFILLQSNLKPALPRSYSGPIHEKSVLSARVI